MGEGKLEIAADFPSETGIEPITAPQNQLVILLHLTSFIHFIYGTTVSTVVLVCSPISRVLNTASGMAFLVP